MRGGVEKGKSGMVKEGWHMEREIKRKEEKRKRKKDRYSKKEKRVRVKRVKVGRRENKMARVYEENGDQSELLTCMPHLE